MVGGLAYLLPRHRVSGSTSPQPDVAVVVPVRNRQESIRSVIEGVLASDYSPDLLHVVVVDAGSSDATVRRIEEIARKTSKVHLVQIADPIGRGELLREGSRAYPQASIVVMVDPSVTLEGQAIRHIVTEFRDPWVAAVSGRVRSHPLQPFARFGWWRVWEHFLRRIEGAFDSAIGCNSLFYAVRRDVTGLLSESAVAENVDITYAAFALSKGCRVAETATGYLTASPRGSEERALSAAVGGRILALMRRPGVLVPFVTSHWWQTLSHEFLRLFAPIAFAVLFFTALVEADDNGWMMVAFLVQVLFYGGGLLVFVIPQFERTPLRIGADFIRLNLCWLRGFGVLLKAISRPGRRRYRES